ncbi:TPA: 2-oxoacid:acceptor oxidoreductase subunit alpha [Candidatus Poribacteria bacterium]|nr:2-oxoacid:acceptor oxidoreductase subunit alpha [Candidatus Poribacteria bacterium]HIA65500.1 2-oxoacid:acceptor oxidoreductase subunit alpha [Candidatus Poribacteria bacterium]HIB89287.1 2-oxoacid:acceptor oxidoreductase subunit alpha [Candidatus Poribacteria bacterium]HIC02920.1 2-oxoacid:acceptor oxidoreductase subunit alpha [Candidatus Poribacteria bacterium]HIO08621.1 2-oxoacid:acceptor oxidoreductase subunit alpha [Candidatus Poribacteria bacterium]
MSKPRQTIEDAIVLFAGDSGDGSQTIGAQMTQTSAMAGNDVSTHPDFPAEIRAPAGSLAGVSGFQLHFSSRDIYTPGDKCDVLVAMNPAALTENIKYLKPNGLLIVNIDNFQKKNLDLAGYVTNPLEDDSLSQFQIFSVELTYLTREALAETELTSKEKDLCKNFFALGVIFWLFNRPIDYTLRFLKEKFGARKPQFVEANTLALKAGIAFAEATDQVASTYEVKPAKFQPGKYRNIMGNAAAAIGLIAASQKAGLQLVYGSYPITPASDILHELSKYKEFGVKTMQMEDEIAAVGSAIGASFGGALGVTGSSGPGIALKAEAIGLAVMVELPLVILNIQRAGPSTGMPTKTEQSDLLQVLYGRNGESPVPVVAAARPSDCFDTAYEAARIALKYMTPVFFLSDNTIANGAEPWRIPDVSTLPSVTTRIESNGSNAEEFEFMAYARDEETLARPWAIPGTLGLEHRIGGLEKQDLTGNVSYDPENHEKMSRLRDEKVARIANDIPPTEVFGQNGDELLIIGWGGTFGALRTAVKKKQTEGVPVSHVHLRYLNPLPADLGDIINRFKKVVVAELNLGQIITIIRARYLVDAIGFNKIQGQPFYVYEVESKIDEILER